MTLVGPLNSMTLLGDGSDATLGVPAQRRAMHTTRRRGAPKHGERAKTQAAPRHRLGARRAAHMGKLLRGPAARQRTLATGADTATR